jgi:ankyrin repeat protein
MLKIWIIMLSMYAIIVAEQNTTKEPKEDNTQNVRFLNLVKISDTLSIIDRLKENNININYKDEKSGKTSLHYAVQNDNDDIVNIIIENNANINELDNYGNTPLHLALENNNKVIIRALIKAGADINIKNNDGFSVIDLTIINKDINNIIVDKPSYVEGEPNSDIHNAINMSELSKVKKLLEYGIEIDRKNNYGNTPLHNSAQNGNLEITKLLLANKASFQDTNNYGETAMDLAIENGNFEIFDIFNEKITAIKKSQKKNQKYMKENSVIIDNELQIAWQIDLNNERINFDNAKKYCLNLELSYYNDWRLPTIEELNSIINAKKYKPAVDEKLFPNTKPFFYWTSTKTDVLNQYETIDFNYGDRMPKTHDNKFHVRCVRSMD